LPAGTCPNARTSCWRSSWPACCSGRSGGARNRHTPEGGPPPPPRREIRTTPGKGTGAPPGVASNPPGGNTTPLPPPPASPLRSPPVRLSAYLIEEPPARARQIPEPSFTLGKTDAWAFLAALLSWVTVRSLLPSERVMAYPAMVLTAVWFGSARAAKRPEWPITLSKLVAWFSLGVLLSAVTALSLLPWASDRGMLGLALRWVGAFVTSFGLVDPTPRWLLLTLHFLLFAPFGAGLVGHAVASIVPWGWSPYPTALIAVG